MIKNLVLALFFLLTFVSCTKRSSHPALSGYDLYEIPLKYPLLVVKGSKGFLACAYVNTDVCSQKTEEACAIVSGVKTHEDMLEAKVVALSSQAQALGLSVGMSGEQALTLLK